MTNWYPDYAPTAADKALRAELDLVCRQQRELGEWLARATPKTPEGLRAKARVVLAYMNDDPGADSDNLAGMSGQLERSIIRDMAGRG